MCIVHIEITLHIQVRVYCGGCSYPLDYGPTQNLYTLFYTAKKNNRWYLLKRLSFTRMGECPLLNRLDLYWFKYFWRTCWYLSIYLPHSCSVFAPDPLVVRLKLPPGTSSSVTKKANEQSITVYNKVEDGQKKRKTFLYIFEVI